MKQNERILILIVVILVAVNPASRGEGNPVKSRVVHLEQGWSQIDRLTYYNTSQGSAAMSYDILLHLEKADSEKLFRSDENIAAYGLVPQQPDPKYNPDGLPLGVTKTIVTEGQWKGEWVGLTCAACHNGQLEYKGTRISISGGNNGHLDILAFVGALDDAVAATERDPQKFTRLAEKLGQHDAAGKEKLRQRLRKEGAVIHQYREVHAVSPHVVGPGRMDALRLIHNRVQSGALGVPENWVAPLAPVKPSFCWNVPQSAWGQWSAVLKDPLARNAGQALGVFAQMDLTSKTPEEGLFDSTIDYKGLLIIEDLLRRLAPPAWPEEILGKIDREKAAKGKQLFVQNCSECHSTWPHRWSEPKKEGKRFIENAIVPGTIVGTDKTQFGSPQFESEPTVLPGPMRQYLAPPFKGVAALAPPPVVFEAVSRGIVGKALSKLSPTKEQLLSAHGYRAVFPEEEEPIPALFAYKAGPAEGFWSAPPFLHNGSVPNLYELLTPAGQRSKKFYIGREFDPLKVGVDTSGQSGKFLYDTSLIGNSNAGHSFEDGPRGNGVIGRMLTEDERWALIEYLKSLPTAPAQITPYGGPENPVRAWDDKTFFHITHPGTYEGAPTLKVPALGEESVPPSEQALIESISKASIDRLRKQFPPGVRPVLRDAHPKAHGLVRAQFIVLDDLPDELRHGLFKKGNTYDAWIRLSAGNIKVQPDTVPQARGMAIKVLGVEGEKILEAEKDAKTQDFIMINFPGFFVRNLEDYEILHQFMEEGKLEGFFKDRPEEAKAAQAMRNQPFFNPLQVRYWSQTAYKLGPHAMKFSALPISRTSNRQPEVKGPDFLHEAMKEQLKEEDVYFEFLVQLQTDPIRMPVEDPVVIWAESDSPFRRVAIIRIPKQDLDAPSRKELAENIVYSPWHSLPEHRPLGAINRARRLIYEAVADFRLKENGVRKEEPTSIPQ